MKHSICKIFGTALFSCLLLILSSCSKAGDPLKSTSAYVPTFPVPVTTPATPDSIAFPATGKTFLALGDSYTIGQSVTINERFPYQTAKRLIDAGIAVKQPKIIATTGWTTQNLLDALNTTPPGNDNDIVTLLIGVNNQYQGLSQDQYRAQFTQLLNRAINYAGGDKAHVFVLSIPDYSVTPFAANSNTQQIAMEIDQFNAINKEITLAAGIKYIDITPISRQGKTDATMQASDGLHPSGKQYGLWTDLLAPVIKASL